jgi:uncharacterized membrane protein YqiK
VEQPLQRLNNLWANWSRHPVRACLIELPVTEIVRSGANQTREALRQSLLANPAVAEMGLGLVSVQVDRVAPTPEVEGALQTPARERIQQKADEATFQRRALAVEKERAIKENEMATELMLRQRREDLVRQEGANELLAVKLETQRQRAIAEGAAERAVLKAQGQAEAERIVAGAEAEQRRRLLAIENEAEARRVEIWHGVPASVTLGLAARRFADKVDAINHLNLAPDLLGQALQRLLLEDVAAGGDGMGVADASTAGVDGGE